MEVLLLQIVFDIVSDDNTQVQHKTFAPFEHYVTYYLLELPHHRCKYEKPINWLLRLFSPTEMADICQFFSKRKNIQSKYNRSHVTTEQFYSRKYGVPKRLFPFYS